MVYCMQVEGMDWSVMEAARSIRSSIASRCLQVTGHATDVDQEDGTDFDLEFNTKLASPLRNVRNCLELFFNGHLCP